MTVETTQPSGETPVTEPAEPAAPVTEPAAQAPRTVEEVENEYKARISGKDKAHAAETSELRQQLARLQQSDEARRRAEEEARTANMTADQRAQDHIATLTRQLEERDRAHTVELRKIKFPTVAAELDETVLAVTDEAKLASLEAKLTGLTASPPSLIDSNSVARTGNGATPKGEPTADELRLQLEKESPAFAAELGLTRGR